MDTTRIEKIEGYLCKDITTFYLSDRDQCDDFDVGMYVILVFDDEGFRAAEDIGNHSRVSVVGTVRLPPSGAIRSKSGVLLGTSIHVRSISMFESAAPGSGTPP